MLEPKGHGGMGKMVSTLVSGNVMSTLKEMIVDVVESLLSPYEIDEQIDLTKWRNKWLG